MAAAVRVERAWYRYPGGDWVLRGLELGLEKGEYTAVFGANGSGKSSGAYLLNGLVPHFFGGTLEGCVEVENLDTRRHAPADLFSRVGLVLQNPEAQLFSSRVRDELAFGLESLGLAAQPVDERIAATAAALGIEHLLDRPPGALSGGEQRLAAIASVLVMDPPHLVLDEPFASLDWTFSGRVRSLLADLHRRGKTVTVIEHRAEGFLEDAVRLAVFDRGRRTYCGPAGDARRVLSEHGLMPRYPGRSRPPAARSGAPVLEVARLGCTLGGRVLLEDVSFQLRSGEIAALVGRNGAGKSTLVRHLIGLLQPSQGGVFLHGRTIRGRPVCELGRRIGVCFQNPADQFFRTTVRDELQVGLGRREADAAACLAELCRRLRIEDLLDRSPYRLSEGEKKQAAIAAVLATGPEVLVLDEPTVSQDAAGKETLAAWIGELADQGLAVLVATHDLDFAEACAGRWIWLDGGRVRGDGAGLEIRPLLCAAGKEPAGAAAAGGTEPGRAAGSGLNPLTRLVLLAAGIGAVLAARSNAVLLAAAAAAAVLPLRGGRERRLRSLRLIGPMAALVFALGLVFFDLQAALALALRVIGLLGVAAAGFAALRPEEVGSALAAARVPPGPAFMLTAGLRYVPLIEQKIRSIRDAQQARGIDLRPRLRNIGNWMALLLPLLVQSALLADELALAMEARGFSAKGRAPRRPARWRLRDAGVMAAALGALAALVLWERGGLG